MQWPKSVKTLPGVNRGSDGVFVLVWLTWSAIENYLLVDLFSLPMFPPFPEKKGLEKADHRRVRQHISSTGNCRLFEIWNEMLISMQPSRPDNCVFEHLRNETLFKRASIWTLTIVGRRTAVRSGLSQFYVISQSKQMVFGSALVRDLAWYWGTPLKKGRNSQPDLAYKLRGTVI